MRSSMFLGGITSIIVVLATILGSIGTNFVSGNVEDDKTAVALHHVSQSLECLGDILQDTVNASKKNNDVVQKLTQVTTDKMSQVAEKLDEQKSIINNMNKDLLQAISNAATDKISNAADKLDEHKLLIVYMKEDLHQAISNAVSELTGEIRNSSRNSSPKPEVESQNMNLEAARECMQQQKIEELVQQANSSQDWSVLYSGLEKLLDQESEAYWQLRNVSFGENPLRDVGENGYTELVSVLLSGGISVEMETNVNGDTLLHLAAIRGHLQLVKFLLMHGADVDAKNRVADLTPVSLAANRGHLEVVKWLVRAGADITIKQKFGHTATDLARISGHAAVVQFLEKVQQLSH